MKIQGHLREYPLPMLLEVLADRHESGCLSIAFEPEPATFHFKSGQLVAGRFSMARGQAAIDLALEMSQAPFEFDNEMPMPVANSNDPAKLDKNSGMIQQAPKLLPLSDFPRPKLLRIMAVILVIAVPAAVGITLRLGKRTLPTPANAATTQETAFPISESEAPAESTTTPSATILGRRPLASRANNSKEDVTDQVPISGSVDIKTVAESKPSKVISEVTKVNEEAGLAEPANTSSSRPGSRLGQTTKTIVVEVQIDNGRVTGAWVKNSRKGQEAFEAAALRIIRQRRYAKESTGTDSVAVDVTVNQLR
jgi:hypothetical protein